MNFLQSEHWENEIKKAACQCIQSWWRRAIFHPRTLQALRNFKLKKKAYRKFLDSTPHFSSFVENMRQDTEMVRQTLSKIEGKVVSGLDLGKLDTRGGTGLAGLAGAGAGGGIAAMGGNPVPSKVFGDVMLELAQLRKANTQLKAMIKKGNMYVLAFSLLPFARRDLHRLRAYSHPFRHLHAQLTFRGWQPTRPDIGQRLSARRRHYPRANGRHDPGSHCQHRRNNAWPRTFFGVFAFTFVHRTVG